MGHLIHKPDDEGLFQIDAGSVSLSAEYLPSDIV